VCAAKQKAAAAVAVGVVAAVVDQCERDLDGFGDQVGPGGAARGFEIEER
jgi:hypothetical protein